MRQAVLTENLHLKTTRVTKSLNLTKIFDSEICFRQKCLERQKWITNDSSLNIAAERLYKKVCHGTQIKEAR